MSLESTTQNIQHATIEIDIRREDLLHQYISGNKYRKLKYNIAEAKKQNQETLLTFGGAFSNHIAAVAYAGKTNNLQTIGIIRGEELALKTNQNPTLQFAAQNGMQFKFISREAYKQKETEPFVDALKKEFSNFYLLPEGGTNALAVKGCQEILTQDDSKYNYICCPVGTGGTIAGIINASAPNQQIIGFPAVKGDFLQNEIAKFATKTNYKLITNYHFGGYGKTTTELITFINNFYLQNKIPLDPVYTGKMMFAIYDLIKNNYFPKNSKILVIHTGGLQGIEGMNIVLQKKGLSIIKNNE